MYSKHLSVGHSPSWPWRPQRRSWPQPPPLAKTASKQKWDGSLKLLHRRSSFSSSAAALGDNTCKYTKHVSVSSFHAPKDGDDFVLVCAVAETAAVVVIAAAAAAAASVVVFWRYCSCCFCCCFLLFTVVVSCWCLLLLLILLLLLFPTSYVFQFFCIKSRTRDILQYGTL